jgi:hypothetical protein
MAATLSSPAIYLRCSSGFGNKIFELISAIYLKNKYKIDVYLAIGKSLHDNTEDPFFGNIFYKSYTKVKYIFMKKYYTLKNTLPITEQWIDDLDKLPEKITTNIRFAGLYRFAYLMYSSFDDADKNLFDINSKLLDKQIYDKYIVDMKANYACVHIRYGDKLCYGLEEFKHTKYTPYMLPIYTPQYYIDQINELLKKDLVEILIMTDSVELVNEFIMDKFPEKSRITLFDSHYLDSFYLLTKAQYIIMSHSTFSFAAAYFNPTAICYLVKKYFVDKEKDYLVEDDALSPKWIIIDNKNYILNFDQPLVKKMVDFYSGCNKYITQKGGQKQAKDYGNYSKKFKNEELENLVTNGPTTLTNINISENLAIFGTLRYQKLIVEGVTKIYGTVYGKKGDFNNLKVYGPLNIETTNINKLLCDGTIYAEKINIKSNAVIVGSVYILKSIIKNIELSSTEIEFSGSSVDRLTINNKNNKPIKITINSCIINKIVIRGKPLSIAVSVDSKINKIINGTITINE